ncbi:Ydc2-catalyt-domain-containing protein [Durotheca rogersii]|uniref:Ydc2-catalyt-domain-containing protein n=1 Tax=Durotheca rogersii TaxID=419775 RepID=UPI0022211586|nr:Ydc2-catalyt-domain-containing protein [Durotheca rogersii]KAI5862415.1 Ydc2-catalyt-domain-containing protein [Durotheca rogersii]
MSSNLTTLLPKLKQRQLVQLALLCGVQCSGTKADITEHLVGVAPARPAKPLAARDRLILSIDPGIRNLGYSVLSPAAPERTRGRRKAAPPLTAASLRYPPRVILHAWRHRDLLEEAGYDEAEEAAAAKSLSKTRAKARARAKMAEYFNPTSLAVTADRLLRDELVLPLQPTQVLVERQRWRTHGASAILEWTLRVNTLEAMLHASMRTMRELGRWTGDIAWVVPERVARLWEPILPPRTPRARRGSAKRSTDDDDGNEEGETEEEGTKKKRGRPRKKTTKADDSAAAADVMEAEFKELRRTMRSQDIKKHKMRVLQNWLLSPDKIIQPADDETKEAIERFQDRFRPRRARQAAKSGLPADAKARKLDDLTDSILQGMAWLKWEENRALLLREERIPELLDSDLLD